MDLPRTNEEYFSIRTDIIWYFGHLYNPPEILNPIQKDCLSELGSFLMYGVNNQWRGLTELWELYKEQEGFTEKHDYPEYSIKGKIRDMGFKGFYFGKSLSFKPGTSEPIGVFLAEPILVDYQRHKQFFHYLFPYRFVFLDDHEKIPFLNHHLSETFAGNTESYREFLNLIKVGSKHVFKDNIDTINQYIDSLKHRKQDIKKTPTIVAYMIKFIKEHTSKTTEKLIVDLATLSEVNIRSTRKIFFEINRESSDLLHRKKRKQIEYAIELLLNQPEYEKAHKDAVKFLKEIG